MRTFRDGARAWKLGPEAEVLARTVMAEMGLPKEVVDALLDSQVGFSMAVDIAEKRDLAEKWSRPAQRRLIARYGLPAARGLKWEKSNSELRQSLEAARAEVRRLRDELRDREGDDPDPKELWRMLLSWRDG